MCARDPFADLSDYCCNVKKLLTGSINLCIPGWELMLLPPAGGWLGGDSVDAAYGRITFKSETERVAFLFERYQQLSAPLEISSEKAVKNRGRKIKP